MTTAAKKPAAKTAKPDSTKPEKGNAINRARQADALHPDVDTSKHGKDNLQEPNTAGAVDQNVGNGATAALGLTGMIGADAPDANKAQAGSANNDVATLQQQDYVYSHEQALALPVVDKGTAVKMPSDAQIDKMHKQSIEDAKKDAREKNESLEDGKKIDIAALSTLPRRVPVVAWKDKDRNTMVLVKGKDGLAAMKQVEFAEAAA